jgi:hypothetical protein
VQLSHLERHAFNLVFCTCASTVNRELCTVSCELDEAFNILVLVVPVLTSLKTHPTSN